MNTVSPDNALDPTVTSAPDQSVMPMVGRVPVIQCRVAVNTQARAGAWASTHPEFRDPGLCDWIVVERHTRRIIRKMKKIAEQGTELNSDPGTRPGNSGVTEGPPSVS